MQEACHTAPSEIRCEDEIPGIRRRLKSKLEALKDSNFRNSNKDLEPVYNPLDVRTCDPCPPAPREPVEQLADTLNCRYEEDDDDGDEINDSLPEISRESNRPKRKIQPQRKIQFETKCREFTPSCGGTDSVNFQVLPYNKEMCN